MTVDALAGLCVVEFSETVSAAYAAKLFADAGADVVVVEPPAGSPLRRLTRWGPLAEGEPDGPLFRWLAAGKRATVATDADPALHALAQDADVVITDRRGPLPEALGLLPDPANVVVTLSPYGRGLLEDAPGNDFTAQAISGAIGARGLPDKEPVYAAGRIAQLAGGVFAAPAALAAVRHRAHTGQGTHIDVSCAEAVMIATNLFQDLLFREIGMVPPTPGRLLMFPGIETTSDGWIGLNTNSRQKLEDLLIMIGRADLIGETDVRFDPERRDEYMRATVEWLAAHTSDEVLALATEMRVPVAPIGNGEVLPTIDHFVARGVFLTEPYGVRAPRPHYAIDGDRPAARGAAPTRGEQVSIAEVAAGASPVPTAPASAAGLPLAGLKVLDLTAWWAGPASTQLFAALGADVIHVESIQVMDAMRAADSMPFAAADLWWERGAFFQSINTNKRGITLDLGSARGRELLLGLVDWADVMVENYTPRVLPGWGLDWDTLHARNPRLVVCRMPAFGLDGPWSDRVGFAQTVEQVSGLSWGTGYRDGPPIMPNGPCDPLGGMHAAFAILVGLRNREETGLGCLIESPLVEGALNLAAEEVLEYSAFGRLGERLGNRSRERAPQGVYPCAGTEQWVALSVDDEQWPALVDVLGTPAWAADPALATVAGRFAAHDAIDEQLRAWFADRERDAAVEVLQGRGIPAAPVVDHRDVVLHPLFVDRGFAEWCEHPVTGRLPVMGLPFRWSGIDRWITRTAPTIGQHNREVLTQILGVDEAELRQLEAEKVIGTRPLGL